MSSIFPAEINNGNINFFVKCPKRKKKESKYEPNIGLTPMKIKEFAFGLAAPSYRTKTNK
jgi:hypothetical protein